MTTDLGTLGGSSSAATALNNAGQVTGWSYTVDNQFQHAFLYSGGTMTDIGTFGGASSYPSGGINASGQVAGYAYLPGNNYHAFLYTNGTLVDLGTLGGDYSHATAINDAGDVIGWSQTPTGDGHTFLYRNGTLIDLGTLGGSYSSPTGINAAGDVTGVAQTANGEEHAFLYRGGVMMTLVRWAILQLYEGHQRAGSGCRLRARHRQQQLSRVHWDADGVLDLPGSHSRQRNSRRQTTLLATLTAGSPLNGRTIQFNVNGISVGSASTDNAGVATLIKLALSALHRATIPAALPRRSPAGRITFRAPDRPGSA